MKDYFSYEFNQKGWKNAENAVLIISMRIELTQYNELLTTIKTRIRQAQVRAVLSANSEMLMLYWDIGRIIYDRQKKEGWGSAVIPRLSKDIRNELPEIKGFSVRNLQRMIRFYKEYSPLDKKVPQAVAQLPWGHNILLIEKVKNIDKRFWYDFHRSISRY